MRYRIASASLKCKLVNKVVGARQVGKCSAVPRKHGGTLALHDALWQHHYHDLATTIHVGSELVPLSHCVTTFQGFSDCLGSLGSGAVVSEIHIHIHIHLYNIRSLGDFRKSILLPLKIAFGVWIAVFSFIFYGFVFIVLQHQRRRRRRQN